MEKNNALHAVIMAGGIGSRFWPLSRNKKPKQFLDILGTGKSFIQMTFDRLSSLVPTENIWVVAHADYKELVESHLPLVHKKNILVEPERKNTAPCIAYAALQIEALNPNASMLVAPADHLILNENQFVLDVKEAYEFIQTQDALITFGIQPSRPDTGYGYIHRHSTMLTQTEIYKVKEFVEKPDYNTALQYLKDGNYLWNSGIFLWKASQIILELKTFAPEIMKAFSPMFTDPECDITSIYGQSPSISIDYAVMEKSAHVCMKAVDFGWSDLGTWGSLYENIAQDQNNNAVQGDHIILRNTAHCMIKNLTNQIVAVESLENLIIINTADAILICNKHEEQRIKQLIAGISDAGLDAVL